ncbi:MAG: hypothetical protein R3B48_04895 [Kofleriaceae bacterium]
MAKSPFTRRDEQRELSRRALIKWTLACGAGLGVSRSKVHEILEKHAGKGVAAAASTAAFCNVVQIDEGGGGQSNIVGQLVPYFGIAQAKNPAFSWAFGDGADQGKPFVGTPYPLWDYNGNPFGHLPAEMQVSAFPCGSNNTHNSNAATSTFGLGGKGTGAFAAEMQVTALSSIIPALAIGANPGPSAVPFASTGNVAGAVNLFNSVASRTGGLLERSNEADLYTAHYEILSSLNRVAKNPIQAGAYKTSREAAKFLGKNLAAQLTVTPAELAEYGATGGSNGIRRYAEALAFTVKAFQLGLTHNIHFSGMKNDPHGFWDQGTFQTEPAIFRRVIKTFMLKMAATNDPLTGEPLDRNLVMFWQGDTPKQARNRAGWGDGSAMNHNVVVAYSSGHIKAGWHGDHSAAGVVTSLDDAGNQVAYNGTVAAQKALACIAYAVAKRRARDIQSFAGNTKIDAQVNPLEL